MIGAAVLVVFIGLALIVAVVSTVGFCLMLWDDITERLERNRRRARRGD